MAFVTLGEHRTVFFAKRIEHLAAHLRLRQALEAPVEAVQVLGDDVHEWGV